jgi:hypothetical protein
MSREQQRAAGIMSARIAPPRLIEAGNITTCAKRSWASSRDVPPMISGTADQAETI